MQKVKEFQVDELGIENPQYFQGYGVSSSLYTDCAYGIGDNPREALDDCLEQIALQDIDVEDLEARIVAASGGPFPETPSVLKDFGDDTEELYYYVGIKWSL
jgi:hypothetical protein